LRLPAWLPRPPACVPARPPSAWLPRRRQILTLLVTSCTTLLTSRATLNPPAPPSGPPPPAGPSAPWIPIPYAPEHPRLL